MRIIQESEIKELIGEATEYDKKLMLELKDPRSWMKSVSAFANGIGGSLIFGIEDKSDTIVGMPNAETDSEQISIYIRDRMDPIPPFVLRFATVDGLKLIILDVKAGTETPYYYVGKNDRTAYHRVGNESVKCDSVKLKELTLKGSGKSYDSLPSGYDFSKMSYTKLISTYYQRAHKEFLDTEKKKYVNFEETLATL